ncbi:unnamed protein product [Cylindrotheca closterium]|uniref:Uncharacterized protein n=1 Tax=Cylindrotheca closterium TaxID=2856 RepID=A0AAD2CKQ2_9STRA|nr:unnamed protein product [Cylindrotheca closterium]
MGTVAASVPGVDPPRSSIEGCVLFLPRWLLPPHADNEGFAAYLLTDTSFDWVAGRPTNLVDEEEATGKYTVAEKFESALFAAEETVSRNYVARFMVELVTKKDTFRKYLHKMPVVVDNTHVGSYYHSTRNARNKKTVKEKECKVPC